MRLLDLVEQHHRVRAPPHRLGERASFLVADIARRRADQPRHGVLLLILRHVHAHHGALIVEQELGECARQLGLADAGRAQEQERAERAARILKPGPRAAHRVGHQPHRLVLSDDAVVQALLHVDQLLDLSLHETRDRNPGPLGHHLGDVLLVDFLLEHALVELDLGEPRVLLLQLSLELEQMSVPQLGDARQITGPLGSLLLELQALALGLELADLAHHLFLPLPVRLELRDLGAHPSQFLLETLEPLLAARIVLLGECLALDLELARAPRRLVELDRQRIDLHAQARRSLVDQVDRLVREIAVGDVAARQDRGRDQRGVLDADPVVHLVAFLEAAQDRDRILGRRLVHQDRLESSLERGVLLDVLAILVERGRPDAVQLTARQRWFEQVGGVHRTLGAACAHQGVQLVDEEHDARLRRGDLLEHGLESVLELAAELGSGDQGAQVEGNDAFLFEALGHVARHDALRQTLDDRGLAHSRLADQHRVVLGAASEHLDHAADLVVAPDHRIELALARQGGQVAPVARERLVLVLRVGVGHALAAAHLSERLQQ